MACPECGNDTTHAWTEPDQGTAIWCTGRKKDGTKCTYSKFIEEEKEKPDPWAFNERMYWRAKLGL